MFDRKTVAGIFVLVIFIVNIGLSQSLEENWNDFLHYIKIGRLDLAKDYARVVLASNPDIDTKSEACVICHDLGIGDY